MRQEDPARRQAILQAAGRILAADPAAPVSAVCTGAGVSRATFYRYFPSRAALLEALDLEPDPGTRERILAAAIELLERDGLARLSMDDVADRAGVSRASVYRLYPGKPACSPPCSRPSRRSPRSPRRCTACTTGRRLRSCRRCSASWIACSRRGSASCAR